MTRYARIHALKAHFLALWVTGLLAFLPSCEPTHKTFASDQAVISHYAAMAHAVYQDSLATATQLHNTIDTFLASPTEQNLNQARAAYKQARIPYQQSEIMRWDSAITLTQALDSDGGPRSVDDWEAGVNAWPLDERHIDRILNDTALAISAASLTHLGPDAEDEETEANVTVGIHAIEYLLWGSDPHGTQAGAGERNAAFFHAENCAQEPDYHPNNSPELCQRRRHYLSTVADLLVDDLHTMTQEWEPTALQTPGTLGFNFTHSPQAMSYILGAMRQMAGAELAVARMYAGLGSHPEEGDTEEEHDCFSDLSHLANYYNFIGVKNAFLGQYGALKGPSLADLVRQKDTTTYQAVITQLDSIETKLRTLFEVGERRENPIRFDQIIGQLKGQPERTLATEALRELMSLSYHQLHAVKTLLSLDDIDTGSGDGD